VRVRVGARRARRLRPRSAASASSAAPPRARRRRTRAFAAAVISLPARRRQLVHSYAGCADRLHAPALPHAPGAAAPQPAAGARQLYGQRAPLKRTARPAPPPVGPVGPVGDGAGGVPAARGTPLAGGDGAGGTPAARASGAHSTGWGPGRRPRPPARGPWRRPGRAARRPLRPARPAAQQAHNIFVLSRREGSGSVRARPWEQEVCSSTRAPSGTLRECTALFNRAAAR